MVGSVNKVILVGNLGADPEIRHTQDGRPIANLRLATSESWHDKMSGERREHTEWHRVVIFNEGLCRVVEQYLRKGSKVYIEGQLQTRGWEDNTGLKRYTTEIVLQEFNSSLHMLDSRADAAGGSASAEEEGKPQREPNLDMAIISKIAAKLSLKFIPDHEHKEAGTANIFTPLDLLDYIYAVLHSPSYRKKYAEFLKIDFPRIPYPKDVELFFELAKLGAKLRKIHLLEAPTVGKFITGFNIEGDNMVEKPQYKGGSVYINPTQYFENVPKIA